MRGRSAGWGWGSAGVGAAVVVGAGGRQVVSGVMMGVRAGMVALGGSAVAAGGLVGGGFVDAVVVEAFELALAETGDAAVAVRHDVIGVAAGGGLVTARRVLAVTVTDLDDPSHCPA